MFVPPCPGDEGIAVGCAVFGYNHLQELLSASNTAAASKPVGGRISMSVSEQEPGMGDAAVGIKGQGVAVTAVEKGNEEGKPSEAAAPFWGKHWSEEEVEDDLEEWEPWVDVRPLEGLEVCVWVWVCVCILNTRSRYRNS